MKIDLITEKQSPKFPTVFENMRTGHLALWLHEHTALCLTTLTTDNPHDRCTDRTVWKHRPDITGFTVTL